MKQKTKEQLITENVTLASEVERLKNRITAIQAEHSDIDETHRLNLSTALGSGTVRRRNQWGNDEQYVYNWFEIFREVGKLLERKKQADLEERVQNQESRLNDLRERVNDIDKKDPLF